MRKLIILFMVFVISLSISCNNMLDVEPENSVTFTNFYKNEQDLAVLVRGMHAILVPAFNKFNTLELVGVKLTNLLPGIFRFRMYLRVFMNGILSELIGKIFTMQYMSVICYLTM